MKRTTLKTGTYSITKDPLPIGMDFRDLLKREFEYLGVSYMDPCCGKKYVYNTCCLFNPLTVNVNTINGEYIFQNYKPHIKSITGSYGDLTLNAANVGQLKAKLINEDYGGEFNTNWGNINCNLTVSLNPGVLPLALKGIEYRTYKYKLTVNFYTPIKEAYNYYNDISDLTSFDSIERVGANSIHYLKWFEVDNVNILNNVNWFTDTFRMEFQDVSAGNRNELDFVGITSANAQSWAKNYCNFINNKLNNANIPGIQYFDPLSEVMTNPISGTFAYEYEFYVILDDQSTLNAISFARYNIQENGVDTLWVNNLLNPESHYISNTLVGVKSFNIQPVETFLIQNTPDCTIYINPEIVP